MCFRGAFNLARSVSYKVISLIDCPTSLSNHISSREGIPKFREMHVSWVGRISLRRKRRTRGTVMGRKVGDWSSERVKLIQKTPTKRTNDLSIIFGSSRKYFNSESTIDSMEGINGRDGLHWRCVRLHVEGQVRAGILRGRWSLWPVSVWQYIYL